MTGKQTELQQRKTLFINIVLLEKKGRKQTIG